MMSTMHLELRLLKRFWCATLMLLLMISFLGCSQDGVVGERTRILDRGLNASPESLDPHRFTSSQAGDVLRDLGEGLTTYSSSGELIGGAAEKWAVSDDGLVYTFYLRPNGRWSNGKPVLAENFVASFRRLVDKTTAAPSAKYVQMISGFQEIVNGKVSTLDLGVQAKEPYVLEIKLSTPTPYFAQLLANPSTFPVYTNSQGSLKTQNAATAQLVTNGAYSLDSRVVGSILVLKRNKYYWDNEKTWFNFVRYHVVSEGTEISRYRAGDLDITNNVDANNFELMRATRPGELKVSPALGIYYYGFNLTKPFLRENKNLRRALSMAIDRDVLVSKVIGRGEKPAFSWVPPGVANYTPQQLPFMSLSGDERRQMAISYYRAAGFGPDKPLEIQLRYNTLGGHQKIALAIQSMWKEVLGFEATLVNEEFKVLLANIRDMNVTEVFRLSWNGDYDDAQTFLQLFETGNPQNLTGYSNAIVDSLLERAATSVDAHERRTFLQQAERIALGDYPVIPIYFYVTKHMVGPDILGWNANPLDIHYSRFLRRADE